MSSILYHFVDGKPQAEKCSALDVEKLLKSGYATSAEALIKEKEIDTNQSGKISNDELKEAAQKSGIKTTKKTRKQLKKELGIDNV